MQEKRYKRRRRSSFGPILTIVILLAVIGLLIFGLVKLSSRDSGTQSSKGNPSSAAVSAQQQNSSDKKASSQPVKKSTATVLSTGDIMVHSTQLDGAKTSSGGYDFSAFFKECSPYFKGVDLSVANLEVTFGSEAAGAYSGYPMFNTPDSLADVIKNAGLNFLVTANNHCYDTGLNGLVRTASVLKQKGLDFVGTKETQADKAYAVKTVNNIKIGIGNFTYATAPANALPGRKYLNGNLIKAEANNLVNTFDYQKISDFYTEAESQIKDMKAAGAEYIVFYMHWGNEYQTTPDAHQKAIAQKLSNLGVNMIIGSHPHVIQPVELIHAEDSQNTTVCLYSTGNCISNQRQELMDSCPSGHTEDGLFFKFTLNKDQNGVSLSGLDLIPTWVNKYRGGSGYQYTVYPLENPSDGASKYGLDSTASAKAKRSYERTKAIVAEGLTRCQTEIGCEKTFQ